MSTAAVADFALAPGESTIPSGRAAILHALWGVLRLEWGRQLLTLRLLFPLLLAAVPLAVTGAMAWVVIHFPDDFDGSHGLPHEYANLYHALIVRVVIFFGSMAFFLNLVRGEVEERSTSLASCC